MKRFSFLAVLCLFGVLPVFSANNAGTSGFTFLAIPVGARATAMGQAFTSVPNDVQGV